MTSFTELCCLWTWCHSLMKNVMIFRISEITVNLLSSEVTVSFSRWTLVSEEIAGPISL